MNQNEKNLINQIENMFESNYNHMEYTKKELKKLGVSDAITNSFVVRMEVSQNLLFETCRVVNDLVGSMTSKTDNKPRRFNVFDKDFEQQVKAAEKELNEQYRGTHNADADLAFNSSFNSGRITSFDGDMDELMMRITEHIKRSDNDNDGGTLYAIS